MKNKKNNSSSLEYAISLIQQGDFSSAEKELKRITHTQPKTAMPWFLLGVSQASQLKNLEAIKSLQNCLKMQKNYPEALNNLGVVLERERKLDEAKQHYQKAVKLKPNYTSAMFNLANIHQQQNNIDDAINIYEKVLRLDPQNVKSINNLGLCKLELGETKSALNLFEKALKFSPADVELLVNASTACYKHEDYKKSLRLLTKAKSINPNLVDIYNNLGLNYQALKNYSDAKENLLHALSIQPNNIDSLCNLGNLYKEQYNFQIAIDYYNQALSIDSDNCLALTNKGICLLHLDRIDEALVYYKHLLKIDPDNVKIKYNLASYYLNKGELINGWEYYQYRPSIRHEKTQPLNNFVPEKLRNKKILVTKEQGIGDELFFLRYIKKLAAYTSEIDYLATPKIIPILRQINDINILIPENEEPADTYDFTISVGDLPLLLQKVNNEFPKSVSLKPETNLVEEIKQQLQALGQPPYIGITWRAGQDVENFLYKTVPINVLMQTLENIPGTLLILQRNPTQNELDELAKFSSQHNIHDFSALNDDIPKMLSLLNALDDYIGVSNTNIHLLAAINKTAHVLIQHLPEWRWLFHGNESPWFPGFRLYRQNPEKSWDHAAATLKHNLESMYYEKARAQS